MIGKTKVIETLTRLIKDSPCDQTLVCFTSASTITSRFYNFRIHQNLNEEEFAVYIKVAIDGKLGVSVTSSLEKQNLKTALEKAINIAKVSKKDPLFRPFPKQQKIELIKTYFPQTILTINERFKFINDLFSQVKRHSLNLAGSFVTGSEEMAVLNSEGVCAYQPFTIASLKLITLDRNASGYATSVSRNIEDIDSKKMLGVSIERCLLNKNPKDIDVGRYDCILMPDAVGEILEWLSYIGFGAKSFCERTSFLSGRIGQKIMGENITIYDDGSSAGGLTVPFDFEGIPKKKTYLVKDGIAKGIVYDTHYGGLHNKKSTGHASPPDECEGPFALNLFIKAGQNSIDDIIKYVRRGIYVTRFHYVNGLLKTQDAIMTGMTRDGTFLIKDGKIKHPIINLRFTQNFLKAFSNVIKISKETKLVSDPSSGVFSCRVPALLIKDFTFTGKTHLR